MIDVIDVNDDILHTMSPFIRKYNGKDYSMAVTIINIDEKTNVFLRESALKRIAIYNDLDSYYPKCKILFEDQNGDYSANMNLTGEYVHVFIKQPATSTENKTSTGRIPEIDLLFIIDKHTIRKLEQKTLTMELECSFYYKRNFAAHIFYATDKDKDKQSPYLLLKNILNKANIPIYKEIPSCTKTIHFISDQNNSVRDHVNYCLWMGASEADPPSFLYYNLIEQEEILFNRTTVDTEAKYACNTCLVLPNENGNSFLENALIIYDFNTYSAIEFEDFLKLATLEHRWEYATDKRQWTYAEFKPQKYQDLLSVTKDKKKTIKSVFQIEEFDTTEIRHYTTNYEYNVYKRLHNLEVGTYCSNFLVEGNVLRDCGQIININCNHPNYANKFGGTWQTYSVAHIFEVDKYVNAITAYRTFNYALREK